jgi:uncharacterized protein YkwD
MSLRAPSRGFVSTHKPNGENMYSQIKTQLVQAATVLAIAVSLTACGGGGGGGSPAPATATTTPTPIQTATDVVTPYPVGSQEKLAFDTLNYERTYCGFNALVQNNKLDIAAKGHADWQLINNYLDHYQVPNTPVFTGVTSEDRAVAAGYAKAGDFIDADEIHGLNGSSDKTIYGGVRAVKYLLNAPYHMKSLLVGFRDVGIAVRNKSDASSAHGDRVVSQFDLASKNFEGLVGRNPSQIYTYPCTGSISVQRQLTNEDPNPIPGRNLTTSPLGTSIYVGLAIGRTLQIISATMVKVSDNSNVVLRAPITTATDPYATTTAAYGAHETYIAADAPLSPNTSYKVTIVGTNNGTTFTTTINPFTTGL